MVVFLVISPWFRCNTKGKIKDGPTGTKKTQQQTQRTSPMVLNVDPTRAALNPSVPLAPLALAHAPRMPRSDTCRIGPFPAWIPSTPRVCRLVALLPFSLLGGGWCGGGWGWGVESGACLLLHLRRCWVSCTRPIHW